MLIRFGGNDTSMLVFNKYNDCHVCLLSLGSMLTEAGNVISFGLRRESSPRMSVQNFVLDGIHPILVETYQCGPS